ncbi:PrpF domain-containing protein [Roseovarius sp.]|uniref:2-methylaconitate cis-trans isomerase PrpF family protein n=1 Tax=Roseovarius sp. TaxID=1486281 RepID=UPI00261767D5|nr:PrpF domain-containing protein [Roseovarius sp.]MDM8167889.1 PrpF domain-containing protein [Roseovarius sp.]
MAHRRLPALFMRGGTSNALVFHVKDLPAERGEWDALFLGAMGAPDPNGRQLDGMGGGISSLSKVCVIGPPSRDDADIDYTFAQIGTDKATVDYAGNCGNMSSAMGPAALEMGLVAAPETGEARVRIHNTNTGKIIVARFPVEDGLLAPAGDMAIAGVAGRAAPIRLEFLEPGGARTGRLLPSGTACDLLALPDGRKVRASLVDAANPCVFVAAADLGKTGGETPGALAADTAFMADMEALRCAGSVRMGMAADLAGAAEIPSVPKVAIVAAPADVTTLSGEIIGAGEMSLGVRMISMEQPHRAVPITGAICLAVAARVPGSVPGALCKAGDGAITVAHPSGVIVVDAEVETTGGEVTARKGVIYRTARTLFEGFVRLPGG